MTNGFMIFLNVWVIIVSFYANYLCYLKWCSTQLSVIWFVIGMSLIIPIGLSLVNLIELFAK